MKGYRYLPHTADVRLEVFGSNQSELFVSAALGMMEYIFGSAPQARTPDRQSEIVLEASDITSLLVDWLSELLYLVSTGYRNYNSYQLLECQPERIVARVGSFPAQAVEDIKAVTYNGLEVTADKDNWHAIVTFDI